MPVFLKIWNSIIESLFFLFFRGAVTGIKLGNIAVWLLNMIGLFKMIQPSTHVLILSQKRLV